MSALLEVRDLEVSFDTYGGVVHAVRGVSFEVHPGETLAIVGESGCGKSVTLQSLMGLIPMPPGRIAGGVAHWRGEPLDRGRVAGRDLRGDEIGMIFQDPMTSLNPTMRVGDQIAETLEVHRGMSRREARLVAIDALERCRIGEPEARARQYPFELSGGMMQRVMIAMAIVCEPALLIADEPTTALDVTVQAEILALLEDLQRSSEMSIILVTHDLAVVANVADRVAVMYAGEIIETGTVEEIFDHCGHPYTEGLRAAVPTREHGPGRRLEPIPGAPPDLFDPPSGCGYEARCPYAMQVCSDHPPRESRRGETHAFRCWLHEEGAPPLAPRLLGGEGA